MVDGDWTSSGDSVDGRQTSDDDDDLTIVETKQRWKLYPDTKIKTEILDEIENFSANDELDIEEWRKEESHERKSEAARHLGTCIVCKRSIFREAESKVHSTEQHLLSHISIRFAAGEGGPLRSQHRDTRQIHEGRRGGKKGSFECSVCRKRLRHRTSMRDHKLMHTNKKSFECSICKKKFLRASSLRAHMIVHTADSPYRCDLCPAKFKRLSVLKTHKLTHTGVKRFECDICKQRFHLKGALKHHILAHYGVRPYRCNDCGKCYRRSWGLKIHTYRHTGVKRFECDLCKARFSIKTKLAKHIYEHTGEKPYKCERCGRQYGERYLLKSHKCSTACDNLVKFKGMRMLERPAAFLLLKAK